MHSVFRDLQFGARLLRNARAFSIIAIGTMALGIGASVTVFSVVNAVLLKPLPFHDPDRLLIIWERNPAQNKFRLPVAPINFQEWRQQSHSFEHMAAVRDLRANLTAGPGGPLEPEELRAERVSAELFPLLGVQPTIGRVFGAAEDQPGHADVAVLSHSLWTRRFAADKSLPGKSIRLGDRSFTVLGVMPPTFSILDPAVDIWMPLALNTSDPRVAGGRLLFVLARPRAGVGMEQVRGEMDTIGGRLEQADPALNRGWRPSVFPLMDELVGTVRKAMLVLLAAVGFLLLMACANVANLLLARSASRRKEIAVRIALGAGRGRLILQLLTESMILALAGGILGLALARGGTALMVRLGSADIPRLSGAGLDATVLWFSLGATVVTGLLFGIAPAIQVSSLNPNAVLLVAGRSGAKGKSERRLRGVLVMAEVALAMVVLIEAGLLVRSFIRLRSANPGFQSAGLLAVRLPLLSRRYQPVEQRIAFGRQVEERIAAIPGVRAVGSVSSLPLTGLGGGSRLAVEGRPVAEGQEVIGLMRGVSEGYFQAIGIPLRAGRTFAATDTADSPRVVVVNQTLARRYWPAGNAIGGRLVLVDVPNGRPAEIVGVVGDAKQDRLEAEEWPTIYSPYTQLPTFSLELAVRASQSPMTLANAIRRAVHQLDPEQPVADLRPMDEVVDRAIATARFNVVVLGIFAAAAFLLAALGIYGVISYDVNERTNEIGIRLALGAQPGDVLGLMLGQGARLAAVGIAIGLIAAIALTRVMATMLYGVEARDIYTFALIAVLLGTVAMVASYIPSRRAMALDPVTALRHE